jgi:hypothetical protein
MKIMKFAKSKHTFTIRTSPYSIYLTAEKGQLCKAEIELKLSRIMMGLCGFGDRCCIGGCGGVLRFGVF